MTKRIKHFIRDCSIGLFSILGISFLYRTKERRYHPLVRVIAFHDVPDGEWFESIISTLVTEFSVRTPAEFHARTFDAEKINVLLTFDDGYRSWIQVCLPILKKYGLTGIFFINSGLLDAVETGSVSTYMREQLLQSPKEALSWEGARALVAAGQTIGGHTTAHSNLADQSEVQLAAEIQNDRRQIEEKLGVRILDFAYPFGRRAHYTNTVVREVTRAGYQYAYTAESGFAHLDAMLYEIPRTLIEPNQSVWSVRRWMYGGYDLFARIVTTYVRD